MANFNKVIIAGNLTRDPEHRVTPQGLSICKLAIAVNRNYKNANGEDQQETTYVDVDAFGKPAEIISKYLGKGRAILVEGRLKTDSWTSQAGEKRSKLKVVLETFQFMDSRGSEAGGNGGGDRGYQAVPEASSGSSSSAGSAETTTTPGDFESKDLDEDIPF